MKCYFCQIDFDNVGNACPNHPVAVVHMLGNQKKLRGVILATTEYEVYMYFDDNTCNIYVKGEREFILDHIPNITPENMKEKIKTYLVFS